MEFEDFKKIVVEAIAPDVGDLDVAEDILYDVLQGETSYVCDSNGDYKPVEINSVEYLEGKGGGEGQGENCYSVIKLTGTGKIYKVSYNYYSYEGVTFDWATVQEVVPKEVFVTQYIPV